MSEFVYKTEEKNGKTIVKEAAIKDVVFLYAVYGDNYAPIYDEKDWSKSSQKNFEQKVEVVVDEDTADQVQEVFPKVSVKKFLSTKEESAKDKLVKLKKIEDPDRIPDLKKLFVLKFTQKVNESKNGPFKEPSKLPKVFEKQGNKMVEITFKKKAGNGSKGVLVLNPFFKNGYGQILYFGKMFVTDLVEYQAGGEDLSDLLGEDFEMEMDSDVPEALSKGNASEDSDEDFSDDPSAEEVFGEDDEDY